MEEKHFWLKLSIILSVVIVLLIGVGFYAYSKQPTTEEEVRQIELSNGVCANSQDFVIFKKGRFTHGGLYILVDKKTRVQYLYFSNGYQGGLSALIDSLGKPILYQGELPDNTIIK